MAKDGIRIACSDEEIEQLRVLATGTRGGIWRIKRAKIILGALQGTSPERLMLEVRVPVLSVVRCIEEFGRKRMAYFDQPQRPPTWREAEVERMLALLDQPPPESSVEWEFVTVRYIGNFFSARQIQEIRDFIAENPDLPRATVAKEICRRYRIHDARGKPKTQIMVDILKRMAMDNIVPMLGKKPARKGRSAKVPPLPRGLEPASQPIHLAPGEIRSIEFRLVESTADSAVWNAVIHHYHYIPGYRLFGRRLRYLVFAKRSQPMRRRAVSRGQDGAASGSGAADRKLLVAALAFTAGGWRITCRDDFIGWNDEQRIRNLERVVNNARFLILPWIHAPNLASRILGGGIRRLLPDWEARYGYRPALLETFVDLKRFRGTCYKASNWLKIGRTAGYSLHGQERRRKEPARAVYVYPLRKDFRKLLCS